MEDKFYKHLIKTAPFGYAYHKIILDENGEPIDYEFLEVNNAFEDITGLKSDKIINKKITSIIPEIERDNFNWIKFYGKVALEGGETDFEQYSIFLKKWFKVQVFSAEKYYFSTVFIDISEEKEKSAELENFFTINLDLLCIADLQGNFIKLNKAWEETLGYSVDYLEKKRFLDFVHPDDYEDTINAMSKLADDKLVINFINRYRSKDNSYRYIEWRSKPRGNLIYAAARDVTDHIELEKKLERKHNDMVSFINNLPFLTWLKDSENRFIMVNEAFASSCGQPNAESLIGKNDLDIWPEDLAQDYINDDLEVMKNRKKKNVEETVNDEGERKWFETYKAPRFDENGNVIGTVGYSRDISSRKKMEHNLALEKQRLADIIEGTNVGTWEWNVQTGETVFNERWANIIGYTLEEISPVSIDTWMKYAHPEDLKKSELLLNKHFKGEIDYYEFESRMRHKNGSWVWVLDRGRVSVWGEDGSPVLMYGTHQDITGRKDIEEKLRESEERLKLIFNATGEGIWDWDITTKKVTHNKQWCFILGLDENYLEHPLDFFADALHPDDRERVLKKIGQAVEKKVNYDSEHRMIKKNGEVIWIHDRGAIISSDEDGNSIRMAGTISDITERKRIEERLKQSEENFRTFFETIDDMIFIGNEKGEIFFTNSSVSNKLGYSKEELTKMNILDVHPKDKKEEAKTIFGEMFEGKRDSCPLPLARKDCSTIPVETRIWFGKWDGKDSIFGISKDLSKEQESLQMFNKIFQNNPALMAISSIPDRIFINVNQSFLSKLGYEKSEIIGEKSSELSIFVDDEVQKKVALELRERGRVNNVELKVRTKSGEILDGLFSGEVIESQGKSFFLTVMTDITAQKEAEKIALAASKAKSEFLANMSHEIRTPLNGVIGFTDLLKNTSLNSVQKQYVDNANNSAHSLLEVINDILDFSKIEAGKIDLEIIETDIVDLVENVSDIIRFQSFSKNIELLLNVSPSIPRFVEVDPLRLRQILINLLSNAVKFTEKGEVELKIDFYKIDGTWGKFIFSVRDTGIGINEEQQKKLFKAFSQADASTTRKFGGTGLGLVISSLLAEKMGSRIELKSAEGEGSVFYFAIESSYRFGEVLTLEDIKSIKRVLVVDDNDNNRLIMKNTFESWNIDFTGCSNGFDALKIIEKESSFDVVIVDYLMPYINGIETIRMIREKLDASMQKKPIILLHSSVNRSDIGEECKKMGIKYNIQKPVKSKDLFYYLSAILRKDETKENNVKNIENENQVKILSLNTPLILIAEDVSMNMILVKTMIKQFLPEAKIVEALNGKMALDVYLNEKADLILMDVQMPEMDGIEATREIRKFEKEQGRYTPIVALTAGAIKEEKDRCLESGMDDFITKPVEGKNLLDILKKYILKEQVLENKTTEREDLRNIISFDKEELMEKIYDNKSLYQELVEISLEEMPEHINDLTRFINEKNLVEVKRIAHKIKGSALNMCFKKMARIARLIEENYENDMDYVLELSKEIEEDWKKVCAYF